MKLYALISFVLLASFSFAQQLPVNCDLAVPGCTTPTFAITGNQPNYNINDFTGASNPSTNPNNVPGNSGCLLSGETVSTFITISVVTTGTLEWSIQGTQSGCFDWIMWPYTPGGIGGGGSPTCGQLQAGTQPPVACNWNGACGGFTGMANPGNLPNGASQSDFEYGLNVTAGQTFLLCLSNYSGTNQNVNLSFFGTANVSCNPSTTDQTVCLGDTAHININSGGLVNPQFNWLVTTGVQNPSGGPTNEIYVTTTTNYQVEITDNMGYDTTLSFTITVVDPPTPNAGADFSVCQGTPAVLDGTFTDPANTHTWTFTGPSGTPAPPNAIFSPNNQAEDPSVQVNYMGTYTFTLTEDNGVCPAVSDAVLVTFGSIQQTYTKTDPTCATSCDGTITVNSPNGTQFSIDGGPWVNTNVFTGVCAGTHSVSSQNIQGCSTTTNNIVLTAPPGTTVDAGIDQIICVNGTTNIQATATGGTSYTYHWDHTTNTGAQQSVTPIASPTYYYVIAENQNGCMSTKDSVKVSWLPLLTGVTSPNDTICPGDTSAIYVTSIAGGQAPYSVQWFDNIGNVVGNQDTILVHPSNTTTYSVHITDACTTPETVINSTVVMSVVPQVSFTVDTAEQCQPGKYTFVNTSTDSYETYWMFTNGLSFHNLDTVQFSENEPHVYDARLIVVSNQGCRDTLRKNGYFQVHEKPRANFFWTPYTPKMFSAEVTFTDNSTNADIYQWTFTDGTPASSTDNEEVVNYPDAVIADYPVYLKVWSNFGCVDSVMHIIQVVSDVIFYAPNTFTPDNDNFNETWNISIQGIDEYDFDLKVYNRFGEVMWESHNPTAAWDGTYGGKIAPDGTYIWVLQTKDMVSDNRYEYKGHVSILR